MTAKRPLFGSNSIPKSGWSYPAGVTRLELHGATITSDAGLLAFRELDDALDLTPIASDYLQESRTGRNIRHHLVPLLRQSIYSRLAGYDDTNQNVRCRTSFPRPSHESCRGLARLRPQRRQNQHHEPF